ncbi:MAG: MBL fold metallo-hydrolase [Candidatus Promineifilaceae bacterium]|nr:MBL fold metallo-hydrolase [Candidatus Promineifilaceae bacterium]
MLVHTLDLNFQSRSHTIASYLVVGSAGPVLVETGPRSTLDTLLERLAEHGYQAADVRHVLVTHIHLDHAGAAGWWAQQGAQIYVHHVGAPHLIDPSKLLKSAGRIYEDQMDSLWGEVVSAPAERVTALADGDSVTVGDLRFLALDTPGHAYHHHTFQLDDVAFTGDAAGIRIPGPAFIDLPAPPPEFHLERWQQTIDRLERQSFSAIYPTHFGRVEDWRGQLQGLSKLLDDAVAFVGQRMQNDESRDQILAAYLAWQRQRARAAAMSAKLFQRYEAANPHFMSVDGIMRYWRKRLQNDR